MVILDQLYDHARGFLDEPQGLPRNGATVFYAGEEMATHRDDYIVIQELDTRRKGTNLSRLLKPDSVTVSETLALFVRSRYRVQFVGNLAAYSLQYALHCERYSSLAGGGSVLVEGLLDADIDQDTPRRVVTVSVDHAITLAYDVPTFARVDVELAMDGLSQVSLTGEVEFLTWNSKSLTWDSGRLDYEDAVRIHAIN